MNYLFTINEKYVEPIKTLLFSISSNNGKANSFYFIYSDISMSCREELRRFAEEKCGSQVFFIQFPFDEFVETLPTHGTWSKEIYYRLFAPYLIKDVSSIIYLDGDTIVTANLSEIQGLEKDNSFIVAGVANDVQEGNLARLNLNTHYTYINSGVLLLNLEKWRNNCSLEELMRLLKSNSYLFAFPDQDFINIIWKDEIKILPIEYNYFISLTERNREYPIVKAPKICHYVFTKPWLDYFEYRTDGPFLKYLWKRGEWKESIRLLIKHRIIRIKSKLKLFLRNQNAM